MLDCSSKAMKHKNTGPGCPLLEIGQWQPQQEAERNIKAD